MGAFLYIALMIKKLTLILNRICIYINFERRKQTLFLITVNRFPIFQFNNSMKLYWSLRIKLIQIKQMKEKLIKYRLKFKRNYRFSI